MSLFDFLRSGAGAFAALLFASVCNAQDDEPLRYVGTAQCAECHADAVEAWEGSHHALAWTLPSPGTVLGDFDGAEFAHDGTLTQFRTQDGTYYATVTEKDGVTTDYPVHSVAGVAPLQQYLLETEPGRLQSFDVVWDVDQARWYHLYPDQDLPPDDGLHWTGPYKTWNARCAECHATGYERNYGAQTRSYASTQAEIGVGCEACHGPGSAHIGWANGAELTQSEPALDAYGFSMTFGVDAEADIQQCATCHSRREALTDGNPLPGTNFHDAHRLALLRPGLYHPDGQILDEVYVYGSFLQSKMYAQGVSCMDCHTPHTAKLIADDNSLCTQCHSEAGNDRFPTLRLASYDDPAHHFHPADSVGAQCKSCHMIERTYMGIDGRRDHSFRIPRPDLASETGGPDACTDCHADQTSEWAAAQIEDWYPDARNRGPHYGQALALGQSDPVAASGSLRDLALDPDAAGIVRATALFLLQPVQDAQLAEDVTPLLQDPDPLIRAAASELQVNAPVSERVERLAPLLADPRQMVRMSAARQFLGLPADALRPSQQALLRESNREWQRSLGTRLDFPETHLVLGGLALTLRNYPGALAAFREVVTLDPQRAEAWSILIRLTDATEGRAAARRLMAQALQRLPDNPDLRALAQQMDP